MAPILHTIHAHPLPFALLILLPFLPVILDLTSLILSYVAFQLATLSLLLHRYSGELALLWVTLFISAILYGAAYAVGHWRWTLSILERPILFVFAWGLFLLVWAVVKISRILSEVGEAVVEGLRPVWDAESWRREGDERQCL